MKLATRVSGVLGSYKNAITWLSRQLLPGYLTLEPFLKRPIVFDVDDAIWLTTPLGSSSVAATAKRAQVVIVGNQYLANWFDNYSKNIHIIPTAVDTEIYKPNKATHITSNRFVIGWIGTYVNFPYLKAIEGPLDDFLRAYPNGQILVVSDNPPSFERIPIKQMKYIRWSEKSEVEAIQGMDVGLMPLPDTDWTRGKCAFKMLQYMACEVPIVASPVGMNEEVLAMRDFALPAQTAADWYEALDYLYKNNKSAMNMGKNGRVVIKKHFDRKIITKKIAEIFSDLG